MGAVGEREYADRVAAAAAGFDEIGVRRGDTVALWLSNRPEFHVADTGAMQLGAAPFVTEPAYLERALALRGRTALEMVVLVEGAHMNAIAWEELVAAGAPDFDRSEAAAAVSPDDLATLIYTSGTTGAPKGSSSPMATSWRSAPPSRKP